MMTNKPNKKFIKQLLKDLVEEVRYYLEEDTLSMDRHLYDRIDSLKQDYQDYNEETQNDIYGTDIMTLVTMILQMGLVGHIIMTNEHGKDIRTHRIISEKNK